MDFFSGLKSKAMQLAESVSDQSKTEHDVEGAKETTWTSTYAIGAKMMSYAKEGAEKMKIAIDHTIIGELERERIEYEKSLEADRVEGGKLPWEGLPEEMNLAMKQILALSLDYRNLINEPPGEVELSGIEMDEMAALLIKRDPNLAKARFNLVPKQ
ncbi:hypothetical protein PFISCL1PPCAC_27843, partial [Pristionchus fissidentatus]